MAQTMRRALPIRRSSAGLGLLAKARAHSSIVNSGASGSISHRRPGATKFNFAALGFPGRGSTAVNVEHQFPAFSDGTPPLFCQPPHIVDQSGKVIPIDPYALLFQALRETYGIEAIVCLQIVQNLLAFFKPDCLVVAVFRVRR
jgi:hypothetical protein